MRLKASTYLELHIFCRKRLQPLRLGAKLAPEGGHFLSQAVGQGRGRGRRRIALSGVDARFSPHLSLSLSSRGRDLGGTRHAIRSLVRRLAPLLEVRHFEFEESDLVQESRHIVVMARSRIVLLVFHVSWRPSSAAAAAHDGAIVVPLPPFAAIPGPRGRCHHFVSVTAGTYEMGYSGIVGCDFQANLKLPLKVVFIYWVAILVVHIGWVGFNLGSPIGWWPAAVATYCPSRMVKSQLNHGT